MLKQDSNMIRFVLQESNSAGSVDERLESAKRALMVQVRDKAWIIAVEMKGMARFQRRF